MASTYALKRFVEKVVRAMVRTQRDFIEWTDWTPTVAQGVAVTVTTGICEYRLLGKRCEYHALVTATSAGTAGQDIVISLPVAPSQTGAAVRVGGALVRDTGVAFYEGALVAIDSGTGKVAVNAATGYLGANPAFTLGNNDQISIEGSYPTV